MAMLGMSLVTPRAPLAGRQFFGFRAAGHSSPEEMPAKCRQLVRAPRCAGDVLKSPSSRTEEVYP